MRWYLLVLGLLVIVPSLYATAPVPDIYIAPSYVYELTLFNSGSCGLGSCEDSNWTLKTNLNDIKLADGKSNTKENIKLGGTKQLKVVYDTILDLSGNYYLKIYANNKNDLQIMPYSDNDTVSSSLVVNLTTIKNEWIEVDITSLINHTFSGTGQIILRVSNIDVVDVDIAEMWLRRPLLARDIDIIPQGVTEAEANTVVINTWALVSSSTIPAITNYSCIVNKLNNITSGGGVSSVNVTDLNMVFDIGQDSSYFRVSWDANTSVTELSEGFNYEVQCQGYIGSKLFQGFSQFVYINREQGMWDLFDSFVSWFLQIIGITEDIQELVSGEATMIDSRVGFGSVVYATTFLTYADGVVDVNASCYLDVWSPVNVQLVDGGLMNVSGSDGRYVYQLVAPDVKGTYQLRSYCSGEGLKNRTEYAYGGLEVFDNVVMQMIT